MGLSSALARLLGVLALSLMMAMADLIPIRADMTWGFEAGARTAEAGEVPCPNAHAHCDPIRRSASADPMSHADMGVHHGAAAVSCALHCPSLPVGTSSVARTMGSGRIVFPSPEENEVPGIRPDFEPPPPKPGFSI